MTSRACPTCGGSGQRATARTANGRELERHERAGTPCDDCDGTGHITEPDYWTMPARELADAWRDVDAANLADDYAGTLAERLAFIEDAVLQRIGAPETASGDVPEWQDAIREWAGAHASTDEEGDTNR